MLVVLIVCIVRGLFVLRGADDGDRCCAAIYSYENGRYFKVANGSRREINYNSLGLKRGPVATACARRDVCGCVLSPDRSESVNTSRVIRIERSTDDARNVAEQWLKGKKPLKDRPSRLITDVSELSDEDQKHLSVLPGDVFVNNIEMVNQESRPWCAVATAARMLKAYGIDLTMDELARLMHATVGGATRADFELQMTSIGRHHDLDFEPVREVTNVQDSMNVMANNYNMAANRIGRPTIDTADFAWKCDSWDCFWSAQEAEVREYMVDYRTGFSEAFIDNVQKCIENSDPLAWHCVLGVYDEPMGYPKDSKVGSHMRMIVGYNEDRDEILFSDSWGEGHELKRMPVKEAMAITEGLYYYRDSQERRLGGLE